MTETSAETVLDREEWRRREIRLTLVNALKLGGSLILTWSIALVARIAIPRYLGPERFGALNFADAFAGTAFVLMSFGLDTYVRKELSVRPEAASDFIGGIVTLRLILAVFIYAGMELVLRATNSTPETKQLVYIFGITHFFAAGTNTSAGMLHAVAKVDEMSVMSVVSKLAWAACIAAAVLLKLGLWAFAFAFVVTDGMKALYFSWLARKYLNLRFRIRLKPTWTVLVAALPFYVSGLASTVYDKIGVSLLEFMDSRVEVGWYGAASALSGVTLLLAPLLSWVVVPMFARSAAQSRDELFRMVRRSLEFVLNAAIPVSLALGLGAGIWINLLFGAAFAPAALSLAILAAATLLMYVSIIVSYALAVLNRTWSMGLVFVSGMFINPLCNAILIPHFSSSGVPGAPGAACATATLLTEMAIVAGLLSRLGRQSFDRRLLVVAAKAVSAAILAIAIHVLISRAWGALGLVLELSAYVLVVLVSGAVDVRSAGALAKLLRHRR